MELEKEIPWDLLLAKEKADRWAFRSVQTMAKLMGLEKEIP